MHACIECGLVLPLLTKAMSINDACANVYFGMGDNLNADGNLCACLLDNPDKIQCQTCSSCLSCAKQPIEYWIQEGVTKVCPKCILMYIMRILYTLSFNINTEHFHTCVIFVRRTFLHKVVIFLRNFSEEGRPDFWVEKTEARFTTFFAQLTFEILQLNFYMSWPCHIA